MGGRWIGENSVLAHELVHKVRSHRGKNGLMLLKIDMKKAFDILEWNFINWVLRLWGFSEDFRKLIFSCSSSIEFTLLLNGGKVGSFSPQRGLRQGDPLSPYLFILSLEALTRLIEADNTINGIKVCTTAPPISHILFADDLLIASLANLDNA